MAIKIGIKSNKDHYYGQFTKVAALALFQSPQLTDAGLFVCSSFAICFVSS